MATTNYVLIDFENVQPANLGVLKHAGFKVLVFVGAQQTKVPFDLASAMQALGDAASYLKISGSGRNALDFHIACYLGELVAGEPVVAEHVHSCSPPARSSGVRGSPHPSARSTRSASTNSSRTGVSAVP